MRGRVRTPIPSDQLQPEDCFAVVPAVAHVLPAGGLSYPAASCAFSRRRLDLDTQGSGERATQFGGTSSASQLRSGPHFSEVVGRLQPSYSGLVLSKRKSAAQCALVRPPAQIAPDLHPRERRRNDTRMER